MFQRFCCLLPCVLALPMAAQTTPAPAPSQQQEKVVLRSGRVTMCQIDKGCMEETTDGRKYLVMKTDGFVLKVASGADRHHGYADVSITNETNVAQQVNPADFRMEESEPRLRRLFYVDPSRQHPLVQRELKHTDSSLGKGLPPPSYWTSAEHERDKKQKPVVLALTEVPTLTAGPIAPDGTVSGRVYFERPHGTMGISLLVALPGALFEFPCQLIVEPKGRKRRTPVTDAPGTHS